MNKPPTKRKDSSHREQREEGKGDKTPPLINGGGLSKVTAKKVEEKPQALDFQI